MYIRQAGLMDTSIIQKLAEQSWKTAYAHILSEEQIAYMLDLMYSAAALGQQMTHPSHRFFIFYGENGEPAGFTGMEFHYETATTKLHKIYFLEEAHGKGYGKAAILHLEEQAISQGDHRIILNVNKYNRAKNFYLSQGFRVYDDGIFDIGHGYVMDDFLMEKNLT